MGFMCSSEVHFGFLLVPEQVEKFNISTPVLGGHRL